MTDPFSRSGNFPGNPENFNPDFDPTRQLDPIDDMRAQLAFMRMTGEYQNAIILNQNSENEVLRQQATVDPLTGLANVQQFSDTYQGLVHAHQPHREVDTTPAFQLPHTAIVIDFDNFREINAKYLHAGGNEVLVAVAGVVKRIVHRKRDVAARIGGDEFGIILARTGVERGLEMAENIRSDVADLVIGNDQIRATVSIGVAPLARAEKWEGGVKPADTAAFASKEQGRNRVTLYDPSLPPKQ